MNPVGVLIQVTGKNQLISTGLLDQHLQLAANLRRAAHHGQAEEATDRIFFMGQPQAVHGFYWRALHQALAAHQSEDALVHRGGQVIGLLIGVGRHQRNAEHHVGLVQYG